MVRLKINGPAIDGACRKRFVKRCLRPLPTPADIVIEGGVDRPPSSSFVPLTSLRSPNGSAVVLADAGPAMSAFATLRSLTRKPRAERALRNVRRRPRCTSIST